MIIVGYLGEDAKTGVTRTGRPWFTMRVATHEKWKNDDGSTGKHTEWHLCKKIGGSYNPLVEKAGKKGAQVYIEGALRTRKYMHKDGFERHISEVGITLLRFLGNHGPVEGNDERLDGIVRMVDADDMT